MMVMVRRRRRRRRRRGAGAAAWSGVRVRLAVPWRRNARWRGAREGRDGEGGGAIATPLAA
jgi:hypothetical protein